MNLPGQTPQAWAWELEQALEQRPPHLSIYDLIVEPGTVFERRQQAGQLPLPDQDAAADQLEHCHQRLAQAGYGHYEISSWALPGHGSRHNRVYWSGASWWALGLGATAGVGPERVARPRTREAYGAWLLQQAGHQGLGDPGALPPLEDLLLVGLRRREGVDLAWLEQALGLAQPLRLLLQPALEPWLQQGCIALSGNRLRLLAPQGFALSNAVLADLLLALEPVAPTAPIG